MRIRRVAAQSGSIRRPARPIRSTFAATAAIEQAVGSLRKAFGFRLEQDDSMAFAYLKLRLTGKTITTDRVHIFSKSFVSNSGGGGTGEFDEFLQSLGSWIQVPIVNEVQKPPSREISWHYHYRSPFTDQMQKEDHDPEAVVGNIAKQTNLKFTKQTHPVKFLSVTQDR